MNGHIRIGCAGWAIASRHAALFGDGDSALAPYATRLSVVEINSTFYRSHLPGQDHRLPELPDEACDRILADIDAKQYCFVGTPEALRLGIPSLASQRPYE